MQATDSVYSPTDFVKISVTFEYQQKVNKLLPVIRVPDNVWLEQLSKRLINMEMHDFPWSTTAYSYNHLWLTNRNRGSIPAVRRRELSVHVASTTTKPIIAKKFSHKIFLLNRTQLVVLLIADETKLGTRWFCRLAYGNFQRFQFLYKSARDSVPRSNGSKYDCMLSMCNDPIWWNV